jgi:hypothetical protein
VKPEVQVINPKQLLCCFHFCSTPGGLVWAGQCDAVWCDATIVGICSCNLQQSLKHMQDQRAKADKEAEEVAQQRMVCHAYWAYYIVGSTRSTAHIWNSDTVQAPRA